MHYLLQIVEEITWHSSVMIGYMTNNVYQHAMLINVTRKSKQNVYISQDKGLPHLCIPDQTSIFLKSIDSRVPLA